MRRRGIDRAKLLRGRTQGSGRPAASDGLDRSRAEGMAILADAYLTALAVKNYSPRTADTKRYALTLFLQWAQERDLTNPDQITKPILESYQRHLWRYRKSNGKPLTVGSQIGRLAAVRGYFSWLCKQGYLIANPAADLDMPREERRLPQDTLTVGQVETIINTPDISDPLGVRDRAILELLYSTGIRRTEAARLELHHLNAERHTLAIRYGKGNKDRFVPIGDRALRWTEAYLNNVRPILEIDLAERALFLTGYGKAFTPGSLGNLVRKTIERSGIGRAGSCHLLRHSCATHMHERGADIRVIQQLLGHAKLETTQVYTEVSIKLLQDVHARTHPAAKG